MPLSMFVLHVMQQGDCNALATFQRLMTWVFQEQIGIYIWVYLDNIFTFSDTIPEHEEHLGIVFGILWLHQLFLSQSKLDLYSEDVDCLGHWIDDQGLHTNSNKMSRICKWRTLCSYVEVLQFVGLVKYLAHFMPDVSAYTSPLEAICSNGQPFYWHPLHQLCLDRIKGLAQKTPILCPIDVHLPDPIWVINDASGIGVGGLYGQGPDWQTCHPARFMSKKFTLDQRSYRTFKHEALTVIEAPMKWEDKLVGRKFMIITNHEALETIKTSNCDGKSGRLIQWDEYLSQFKYEVMHIPGKSNKVANCLSWYYENDQFNEIHESHIYMFADVCLDPNLTELHLQELAENNPKTQWVVNSASTTDNDNTSNVQVHHTLLAHRLYDCDESCIPQATEMAEAAQIANVPDPQTPDDDSRDMTIVKALQDGPSLRKIVLGDKTFLVAI